MNYYERYQHGEMVQVYDEIMALGDKAFEPSTLQEIEKVLTELFTRVRFNVELIEKELSAIGYELADDSFTPPSDDLEEILEQMDSGIGPDRFLPLSLIYFYKIVGGVDFAWNYSMEDEGMWAMADPLQIYLIEGALEVIEKFERSNYLQLSADIFLKDDRGGGAPYGIELTQNPVIDARFVFEKHETNFINYLRICFEHCGFPGMDLNNMDDTFIPFYEKVKPQLKPF